MNDGTASIPDHGLVAVHPDQWLAAVLAHHRLTTLDDTPYTRALPRFQRDAAVRLLDILERYRGAVLADDVGLGKTYVSAAVVRSSLERWGPVLIAAPVPVLPYWRGCLADLGPSVHYASFQKLSLQRHPRHIQFGLVVIDEAQHLRNAATKRYDAVCTLALNARLLLVTATPIHNSYRDIANLLRLFLPDGELADPTDMDILRSSLRRVMVRRTRWTISHVYQHRGMTDQPAGGWFPRKHHREIPIELSGPAQAITEQLDGLVRAAFPREREETATSLLVLLLLKRLESSPAAYLCTLKRWRNYLKRAAEAEGHGRVLDRRRFWKLFGEDPDGQLAQLVFPFFFDDATATGSWKSETPGRSTAGTDLRDALLVLDQAIDTASRLTPETDPKLSTLTRLLAEDGRKTIVMTTYQDTARYLFRTLDASGLLLLTGQGATSRSFGRMPRAQALRRFAPRSHGWHPGPSQDLFDILISTDVLCEGVNLQDAARLIHYDLPFNPMTIEQRAGRIDRIGAVHPSIEIIALGIPRSLEMKLGLEKRLRQKRGIRADLLDSGPHVAAASRSVLATGAGIVSDSSDVSIGAGINPGGLLGSDSTEQVGIDEDGFLLACAARLPSSGTPVPCRSRARVGLSGWIAALEEAGEVSFHGLSNGCVLGSSMVFNLLLTLLDSNREPRETPPDPIAMQPPPSWWLRSLVSQLHARRVEEHWLQLEPTPTGRERGSLRRFLEQVDHEVYRAYRQGHLGEVTRRTTCLLRMMGLGSAPQARLATGHQGTDPIMRRDILSSLEAPTPRAIAGTLAEVVLLGWIQLF